MNKRIPSLDDYILEGIKLMSDDDLKSSIEQMTPNDKEDLEKFLYGKKQKDFIIDDILRLLKIEPVSNIKKKFPELLEKHINESKNALGGTVKD